MLTLLFVTIIASANDQVVDDGIKELRFRVLLDDREIGYHNYQLVQNGPERLVSSDARFDVRFLFFNAYRYRHNLTSKWQGDCLASLQAETDANGSRTRLSGQRTDDRFELDKEDTTEILPACVMNFAYWDPQILVQDRLLNPQTGEYVPVDVELLGKQQILVDGQEYDAQAWRINARDKVIELWYSADGERWLALESPAKGGRTLRYELVG